MLLLFATAYSLCDSSERAQFGAGRGKGRTGFLVHCCLGDELVGPSGSHNPRQTDLGFIPGPARSQLCGTESLCTSLSLGFRFSVFLSAEQGVIKAPASGDRSAGKGMQVWPQLHAQ